MGTTTRARSSTAAAVRAVLLTVAASVVGTAAAAQTPVTGVEQLKYPPPPRFEVPRPQRVELENGMVVMLLEDHELPLVTVTALLRTGSRLDPPARLGLAELGGELLRTGGVTRRDGGASGATGSTGTSGASGAAGALSGDAIDDELEGRAATIEVAIGEDSGSATLVALKESFPRLLPLYAAMLRYPAFDAGKLALARDLAKSRLMRQNDDPEEVAGREFARLVYGPDSVYGRTPTFATVDAVRRDDLVAWHRANVTPERIVLGLSGDFQTAEALAAVRAAFGSWPRGAAPSAGSRDMPAGSAAGTGAATAAGSGAATAAGATPAAAPPPVAAFAYRREAHPGLFVVAKGDMSQSQVVIGHLGVLKSDPDYFALQVLDDVLSGSFASRLFAHIRSEKGLAYDVEGRIGGDWDHPGLAVLGLATKAQSTGEGVEALLGEARDLTLHPPTDDEVTRAKQSILASFIFHSDSAAKVLEQQITLELFGYPLDWLPRYRAGVEAVTTDAVRQAAARHLHPEQFTVLVVGPLDAADPAFAPFGAATRVPLPDPTGARN